MATISEMKREDRVRDEETLEDYLARLRGRTIDDLETDMTLEAIHRIGRQMAAAYAEEDIVEVERLMLLIIKWIDRLKAQQAGRIEAAFLTAA